MNDVTSRYIDRFHEVATDRLSRILGLLDGGSGADIAAEFHTLAGEAGLLGLRSICDEARRGEAAARTMAPGSPATLTCVRAVRAIRKRLVEQMLAHHAPARAMDSDVEDAAHVLVVDDSDIVSGQLCDALEDAGLRASPAADHDAAVAAARAWRPAVVLIDVRMERADVRTLCPALRELCGDDTRMILVSGMSPGELAALADEVGASGFIEKKNGVDGIVARALAEIGEVAR